MATNIPNALRSADVNRFAIRAAQVEKAKPVMAYWCYYWIVNQILTKGLHTADDETMTYTMTLMDKLEQMKADNAQNDAIIDDVAGQAYVEQFGTETFQRADNAVRANKASRQTADTFQASATFFDLSRIWGPLNPEIASKIKFAKYHALRIAKALKAGEDPNLSNPTPEPSPTQELPPLDPNDPEVQALQDRSNPLHRSTDESRQPYVEDASDDHDQSESHRVRDSPLDQSFHLPRAPSTPRMLNHANIDTSEAPSPPTVPLEDYYQGPCNGEVSPLGPSTVERTASAGGGYFPSVPDEFSDGVPPSLPEAPPFHPASAPDHINHLNPSFLPSSSTPDHPIPPNPPQNIPRRTPDQSSFSYHSFSPPPRASQHPSYPPQPPTAPSPNPISTSISRGPHPAIRAAQPKPPAPAPDPVPAPAQPNYQPSEETILQARKRIKFADSALEWEDTPTAIRFLIEALGMLRTGPQGD